MTDVLVIGAGPAGLMAALELRGYGLSVTVVDDQPAPGGRIFAAIEARKVYGSEDQSGAALVRRFRASGGEYLPSAEVWQIESGNRVFLTQRGQVRMLEPRFILFATGAQERPMAFPGWERPGVMTVGSAQILLKTARQVPTEPVWFVGTGPLLLLYVQQLLAAGGTVAGILDTTPSGRLLPAAPLLPGALGYGWRDLIRGVRWLLANRRLNVVRNVVAVEALGDERLEKIRYTTSAGLTTSVPAELLLTHDGVIPAIHATMAAGCGHRWNPTQKCFEPVVDGFGASTVPTLFIAGDGGTIAGARAAMLSGRLTAVGIARAAGAVTDRKARAAVDILQRKLAAAKRFRALVDHLYPPSDLSIPDDTVVCRCEEITAGRVREVLVGRGHAGPDGVKIATRVGMGPCQGRQCGLNLTRLVAEAHGTSPSDVGFLRIRPPIKPITLSELATLETA